MRKFIHTPDSKWIWDLILFGAYLGAFSYLCFHGLYGVIPGLLTFPLYHGLKQGLRRRKEERKTLKTFRRMLEMMAGNLRAGLTPDAAIEDVRGRFAPLHAAGDEQERERFLTPSERFLRELKASGIESLIGFSDVCRVSFEEGGDPLPVFHQYMHTMEASEEADRLVQDELSRKLLELRIMQVFPFLMYFYVELIFDGYFDALYEGGGGMLSMSLAFLLYFFSYYLSCLILYPDIFTSVFHLKSLRDKLKKERFYENYLKGDTIPDRRLGDLVLNLVSERIKHELRGLYLTEDENLILCYMKEKLTHCMIVLAAGALAGFFGLFLHPSGIGTGAWVGTILAFSPVAAAGVFFLRDADIHAYYVKRTSEIEEDFAPIAEKLMLYHEAGLTMRSAFMKLAAEYEAGKRERYAFEELLAGKRELEFGVPEEAVYTGFGYRCSLPEYEHFAMLLVQNMHRGSDRLSALLRAEVEQGLMLSVSSSKRKGRRKETKLMVPTVLYLAVILLFLIIPAFARFQSYVL